MAKNQPTDNAWQLALAVLAVSGFVFAEVLVGQRTIGQAILAATVAVSLALVACYARAACLAVGRRLALTKEPAPSPSPAIQLAVIAVATLEMLVVLTSTLIVHLSDAEALQAAGAVTLLGLKLIYGRAALVAVGRRIFAAPADAGN